MSARVFVAQWLARTGLPLLWSLVAWGALLLVLTLGHVVQEGPTSALARLVPPAGASPWAWVNALSAGLALAAGFVGAGLLAASRRRAH